MNSLGWSHAFTDAAAEVPVTGATAKVPVTGAAAKVSPSHRCIRRNTATVGNVSSSDSRRFSCVSSTVARTMSPHTWLARHTYETPDRDAREKPTICFGRSAQRRQAIFATRPAYTRHRSIDFSGTLSRYCNKITSCRIIWFPHNNILTGPTSFRNRFPESADRGQGNYEHSFGGWGDVLVIIAGDFGEGAHK